MDVPKEEIKFSIPLKPITDPDEFSERFLPQALTDEYCTRYLEHIGATPTKANRDMVKKSIPLTNNCIRPHLRTKGYAKDEVVIVVPPVEHEFVLPLATKPSHVLAVQLTNELLADTAAAPGRGGGPEAGGSAAEEKLRSSGEEVTKERYDFRELLDRFMYPFCHVPTFKKMNHILAPLQPGQDQGAQTSDALLTKQERPTADTASATATSALSGDAQLFESADAALLRVGGPASQTDAASSSRGSFFSSLARCSAADSRSRSSASFPAQDVAAAAGGNSIAQELRVEMSQEFNLAPEVILALQSDFEAALVSWHSSSAPDLFRQRVQPAEFRRALDELSSESTLQLFATVVLLLWHWHLPASQHMARGCPVLAYSSYDLCCPARPDQAKADAAAAAAAAPDGASFSAASASERLQQQRILAILQRFSAKYRCLRKTRSGLLFVLPMLLLSLRVLVEQLFARVYPLWTRTQEGRTALLEMDAAVVRLLDPHGYFQRFSCLQSTCGSLDVMLSRQQSMHTPARGHFNDTSPALRASLGQVASIGARLVMQPKAVRRNPRRCTEDAPHPTRQPPRGSRADESDDPQPRAVLAGSGSVDGPVGRRLQLQESEMAAPRQQLLRTQLRQLSYRRKPQPNLSQPGGRTSRSPWLPVPS